MTIRESKLELLLVEDNQAHAAIIERTLLENNLPVSIQHIQHGDAALDYLFRRGAFTDPHRFPRPHLVLLDLRLPRVDGLEVLRTIKDDPDLRRIPVVVLTTSSAEADISDAYTAHANSYLIKPVTFDAFARMMKELEAYWHHWNAFDVPDEQTA